MKRMHNMKKIFKTIQKQIAFVVSFILLVYSTNLLRYSSRLKSKAPVETRFDSSHKTTP